MLKFLKKNDNEKEKRVLATEPNDRESQKQTIEIIKKSALVCQSAFDLQKLSLQHQMLVPITFEERLEEICFTYDLRGLKSVSELKKEEKSAQYQFLINFGKLTDLWSNYQILLTTENVFYDENYLPYVKFRDLYPHGRCDDVSSFFNIYKIFIGGILGQKYSIQQLQECGLEVLKKEPSFDEFAQASSCDELSTILRKRKLAYERNQKASKILVSRPQHRIRAIISIVAPVLLLITLFGFVYSSQIVIPYQEKIIRANEAYNRMDFIAVIDSLESLSTGEMSINTKYILAVSFARGQSLQQEEITRLVSRLSVQSPERELEYWIYLGRLQVDRAQDLAMALNDNQLLIYAYMMELNILENDTTIPGYQKQSRINDLENNIRNLGQRYSSEELE